MKTKIVFNGKETEKSLAKIQEHVTINGKFSGSIDIKKLNLNLKDPSFSYYFSNVNSSEFDYYLNIFKKETTNLNNKEVTFEIQTNDAITATI
tara:strand:- start:641 stop:919 length:279 start_codon:yes stop_codon:yes gene_type:complete